MAVIVSPTVRSRTDSLVDCEDTLFGATDVAEFYRSNPGPEECHNGW